MSDSYRILAASAADFRDELIHPQITICGNSLVSVETGGMLVTVQEGDVAAKDCLLVPGFIDIHVHGGAGYSVMDGTRESIRAIGRHLVKHGVTGWLPTTVTAPLDVTLAALRAVVEEMKSPDPMGARILGIHLEGPYINPDKKGAQPLAYVRVPSSKEFLNWARPYLHAIKIVTLAPEMEGALELIQTLTRRNIITSIGHTNATYNEVDRAIYAGASHVTHCFNAMSPMTGREPGVVGAVFARKELKAELIWDNIHVHPASCKALIAAKGSSGVILISDGIPGAGMPEGYQFSLGDLPVTVKEGAARLPDGTLAGSLLTLDVARVNSASFDPCTLSALTAHNAADTLGLGRKTSILESGADADLCLIDKFNKIAGTIVQGKVVWMEKDQTERSKK